MLADSRRHVQRPSRETLRISGNKLNCFPREMQRHCGGIRPIGVLENIGIWVVTLRQACEWRLNLGQGISKYSYNGAPL